MTWKPYVLALTLLGCSAVPADTGPARCTLVEYLGAAGKLPADVPSCPGQSRPDNASERYHNVYRIQNR